jgi:hypothetical protein
MTEIQAVAGWYNNQWRTTEYRTEHYEDGNSVTRVRSHYISPIELYTSTGRLTQDQLGSKIDVLA